MAGFYKKETLKPYCKNAMYGVSATQQYFVKTPCMAFQQE